MKKVIFAAIFSVAAICAHAQSVTLTFGIGLLADQHGNPIPDGALFQVIASPDADFAAPTSDSFYGGNDILVFSGAFDSSTGFGPGTAFLAFTEIPLADYPIAQANLIIRWFPSLTPGIESPGATFYGEYGFPQDSSWVAPSAGGSLHYQFVTAAVGGEFPDSAGYAGYQTAPIPEPSTYAAIFGALALGFVAYRRRVAA